MEVYEESELDAIRDPHDGAGALFQERLPGPKRLGRRPTPQGDVPRMGGGDPVGLLWLAVLTTSSTSGSASIPAISSYPSRPSSATSPLSLALIEDVRPDVISCALDPEASGPRYPLQSAADDQRRHGPVRGEDRARRRPHLGLPATSGSGSTPVKRTSTSASLNMLSVMESAFLNTFVSQREASFPSYDQRRAVLGTGPADSSRPIPDASRRVSAGPGSPSIPAQSSAAPGDSSSCAR